MLNELVLDLGEGNVSSKVRYHPLQGQRTAAMPHSGSASKGPDTLVPAPVLRLFYGNFAKGAVPAEFFLPSRQVLFSCATLCAALVA